MTYIYDEPIQEGDVTLAPIGFEPPVSAPVNPSIGLNLSDGLAYLSQNASSSAAQQTSFPCSVPEFTGPSATLALPSSSCSPPASNGFLNLLSSSVNVLDNNNNNDLGWECSDLSTWDEKEALSSTQLPILSSLANCQVQHGQLKSNNFEEVENNITLLNMSDEEEADCSEHLTDVSDNLMSPAKKKAQKDDGSLQVTQNTPRKTPRKQKPCGGSGGKTPSSPRNIAGNRRTPRRNLCSQNELVWPPARIKLLLAECLIRKDKVQQEHIPVATWKEISKALKDSGETVSWEVCRGKFSSLSDYFAERLLNTRGFVGGVKVPYYELLCQIYDVPVNFEMPQEVTAQTSSSNKLWDAASISLLLSLYRARQDAFNGTKSCVRHTTLFKEISAAMLPFKMSVTGKQCADKFNELKKKYHEEFDESHRTGASPSTWEYYSEMDALLGKSANMKAPFTVSLGTSTTYKVQGEEGKSTSSSGTRTRTSSSAESKNNKQKAPKAAASGRATFRSRAVDAQETRVYQQNRLIDQIEEMHKTYARQCETQNHLLKMLIEKASNKP